MSQIAIDYRTQYEAAEVCIRELEERIAKAKEILSHSMSDSREFLLIEIGKALDALEGK